jgi:hypothetical protein
LVERWMTATMKGRRLGGEKMLADSVYGFLLSVSELAYYFYCVDRFVGTGMQVAIAPSSCPDAD